jgi:hypothetical protein
MKRNVVTTLLAPNCRRHEHLPCRAVMLTSSWSTNFLSLFIDQPDPGWWILRYQIDINTNCWQANFTTSGKYCSFNKYLWLYGCITRCACLGALSLMLPASHEGPWSQTNTINLSILQLPAPVSTNNKTPHQSPMATVSNFNRILIELKPPVVKGGIRSVMHPGPFLCQKEYRFAS